MDTEFSEADIMLIEKELTRKSYNDIAFLIDKTAQEVAEFITAYSQAKNLIPFQHLLDQKKSSKPAVFKEPKPKKEKKPIVFSRIIVPDEKQKKNRKGEIIFKSKPIDLSKLKQVKIDNKTWIYIKPDQDPVQARIKYMQRLTEYKSRSMEEAPMKKASKI